MDRCEFKEGALGLERDLVMKKGKWVLEGRNGRMRGTEGKGRRTEGRLAAKKPEIPLFQIDLLSLSLSPFSSARTIATVEKKKNRFGFGVES